MGKRRNGKESKDETANPKKAQGQGWGGDEKPRVPLTHSVTVREQGQASGTAQIQGCEGPFIPAFPKGVPCRVGNMVICMKIKL